MKRLSVSIFLLLTFAFMGLAPNLQAATFIITASRVCGGNNSGTISPSGVTHVTEGNDLDITFTPSSGYTIGYLLLNGSTAITDFENDNRCSVDATTGAVTFSFTNVNANETIGVCFRAAAAPKLRITATVNGTGGTITTFNGTEVTGQLTIREFSEGETANYTITPTAPYSIDTIWVDGVVVDIANDPNVTDRGNAEGTAPVTYMFSNITADHTITAKFVDNTVYRTVTLEYYYSEDPAPDFTKLVSVSPGPPFSPATNTHTGNSARIADGATFNFMCMFPGQMPGQNNYMDLWMDSIIVDNVKYTGNITNGYMLALSPAISMPITSDITIKLYMTVGDYRIVKLNFVYGSHVTPATKPTEPVMDLPDFTYVTADSAAARGTLDAAFDLNYQLHDVIPGTPNGEADYIIDSIYVDGVKWTAAAIAAPTVNAVTITGLIPTVTANATITLYVDLRDFTSIPTLTIPSLSINPNPVESKAFITKDANVIFTKIDIIDIMGNVVMTINNPGESLDIDRLNAGSYIVRFFTKDGFATRNIIKR